MMVETGNNTERNNLFPIFLRLEELDTLVVGGGAVGCEKVTALLKASPHARITVVAEKISAELGALAETVSTLRIVERRFRVRDLHHKDLVILATNDHELHKKLRKLTRKKRLLVNVADTPDLCDFYLGAVVTKGNIRIGISTNGKSPTMAKRIRELFDDVIPDNANVLLDNMQQIRDRLKGDFRHKVNILTEITSSWLNKR